VIDETPGRVSCRACGLDQEIPDRILLCACGSADVRIVSGDDLDLVSVELQREPTCA
jgi:hydrogenase nickel incorporation protein HypA/HybF